ncbi:MAG: hypothetical protein ACO38Q_08195 [Aquiluna sp.]
MKLSRLNAQLAQGISASWLSEDRTMKDLGLLDCLNIANCAALRARLAANAGDGRFGREYNSAKAWTGLASDYDLRG